jgi:hypothetical protein
MEKRVRRLFPSLVDLDTSRHGASGKVLIASHTNGTVGTIDVAKRAEICSNFRGNVRFGSD